MKINRFISLSCLSLVLAGLGSQTSSYAEQSSQPLVISQSAKTDNSAQIQAKAEKLLDDFFNQDFQSVLDSVGEKLKPELSLERVRQTWIVTNSENGSFNGRGESKVINTPGSDLVVITLEFDNVTEKWIVIFNDEQEIIGIDFPTSQSIETIARDLVYSLASGDFSQARSYLHPFLKQDIFPQQVQSAWKELVAEKGNFEKIMSTSVRRGSSIDNSDIVVIDLEFGKSDAEMLVIFDSSKSIIGVDLVE